MFTSPPFEPLEEHAKLVGRCSDMLREMVAAYLNEDFELAEKLALRISELEHEADRVKNTIREHLPRSIFMPVDRGDFLNYLREQDRVADRIEEVALTLSLRRTSVPLELRTDLQNMTKKVCDVVDLVPLAVKSLVELLESTFRRKPAKVNLYISLMDEKEQLTDELDLKLRRHIFELEEELTHGELFHLMRVVKLLARVADHAENCGDMMRVMIARL
ncbi:MAG: TIGR00153 family protein [Euryarchaeota archaeon]|nr:TIGR00153 family protein [Euryarchaeota archaeon]